jgi:hypothetical protein
MVVDAVCSERIPKREFILVEAGEDCQITLAQNKN